MSREFVWCRRLRFRSRTYTGQVCSALCYDIIMPSEKGPSHFKYFLQLYPYYLADVILDSGEHF